MDDNKLGCFGFARRSMAAGLKKELTEAVHQKLTAEREKQDALDQVKKYAPNLSDAVFPNNFRCLFKKGSGHNAGEVFAEKKMD